MYLFFDTETSGLPNNWNAPVTDVNNWPRLVQIAWLIFDKQGNKLAENMSVIRPNGIVIPKEASDIHKITQEEALDRVAGEFRKKMHPEEKEYKEEQKEEDFQRDQINKIQDDFQQMDTDISLTYNQGKKILDFKNLADEQGHPYTMDETVFIDRSTWKSEGGFGGATDDDGNITLTTDNVDLFVEGFAYVDLTTGQGYYRQGPKLMKIVVDEEIISSE